MISSEQELVQFQTRVNQMILKFKELKRENEELYTMVDKAESDIAELRQNLAAKEKEYDSLKMAKILEITDDDLETTKGRLAQLIRDVNKCIAILKEQK